MSRKACIRKHVSNTCHSLCASASAPHLFSLLCFPVLYACTMLYYSVTQISRHKDRITGTRSTLKQGFQSGCASCLFDMAAGCWFILCWLPITLAQGSISSDCHDREAGDYDVLCCGESGMRVFRACHRVLWRVCSKCVVEYGVDARAEGANEPNSKSICMCVCV